MGLVWYTHLASCGSFEESFVRMHHQQGNPACHVPGMYVRSTCSMFSGCASFVCGAVPIVAVFIAHFTFLLLFPLRVGSACELEGYDARRCTSEVPEGSNVEILENRWLL